MQSHLRRFILAAGLAFLAASSPAAQSVPEPGRPDIPFDKWFAAGEQQQIPWKVSLREQWMRADLRLVAGFSAAISARDLNSRGSKHELFLLALASDHTGQWFPSYGLLRRSIEQPLPPDSETTFSVNFLVRPGEYTLVLILYDRATGEHNLAKRALRILPIAKDPLPESFRDLPPVEFTPPAEGLDRFLEPRITSRLWLPVAAKRPLRLEVLINFGLPDPAESPRDDNRRMWILSRALRLASQLDMAPGTLRITGMDANSREILFVLDDPRNIPWKKIKDALSESRAGVVSAAALEGRPRNAWFFRQAITNLLAHPSGLEDASGSGEPEASPEADDRPLRVLLVLSNPVEFARLEGGDPLPRAEHCNCRVFYFCYRFVDPVALDQLGDLLGPLRPRRFDLYRPEDLRKALAAVLKEIAGL